jgi:broad specificity phosphatase PhoE
VIAATTVHLLRHGEVYNPEHVLYGRLPGYTLSERGEQQAKMVAEALRGEDITVLLASPLQRAQQTAAPIAESHRLTVLSDADLIEAANSFEGQRMGVGDGVLRHPSAWPKLWNPFRPSWGEPYSEIAERME